MLLIALNNYFTANKWSTDFCAALCKIATVGLRSAFWRPQTRQIGRVFELADPKLEGDESDVALKVWCWWWWSGEEAECSNMRKKRTLQSHSHVVPVVEWSQTVKVAYLNLEQSQYDSQLGYRYGALDVAKWDSNIQIWDACVYGNKSFSLDLKNGEVVWIPDVWRCVKGEDALTWFRGEMHSKRFWDWTDFKCRLLARFDKKTDLFCSRSKIKRWVNF